MSQKQRDLFLHHLPKAELHVHIEGTLTPQLACLLAGRNNVALRYKTADAMIAAYAGLTTLSDFLELYYDNMRVLLLEDDFYLLASTYLATAAEQHGVRHVELFFDAQAHTSRGVPFACVVRGLRRALREAAARRGTSSRLVMCVVRDRPVEEGLAHVEFAASPLFRNEIDGIGLDSDEINYPPSFFYSVYERARLANFFVVGHGGHDGPAVPYVSELLAIPALNRIDHGVTIVDDPELVARARALGVPFTVCPISNVRLAPHLFPSLQQHPIMRMVESGLRVTVNSDDPAYLGAFIGDNYTAVADAFGLTNEDMVRFAVESFMASNLSDGEKQAMLACVRSYVGGGGGE
eukprot:gnl/Spiro4/29536_TR14462_c0_g1_i1.p1 gnl/Spiro4/29536_TR14462_c0_g1~~gnl/Spiro4/29536_TR14462_c0_g1_i1.p1  ORF type:complete len:366 (+),score=85.64 gnl/Spiro4/29536_TR14462_c0_g1_i1:50-1099(+)